MMFETSAIGIDVDTRGVHLVRVDRRLGRTAVTLAAHLPLPDSGEGIALMTRWLISHRLPPTPAAVAVSGRTVILNSVPLDAGAHAEAVAAGAIQRLRFLSEEPMTGDFSQHPGEATRDAVLIALAHDNQIEAALAVPDEAGLQVNHVLPLPLALLRAASSVGSNDGHSVLVHLRSEATHVVIPAAGALQACRRVDIGLTHIRDAICNATGLQADGVDEWLMRAGLDCPPDVEPPPGFQVALESALATWLGELASVLHGNGVATTPPVTLSGSVLPRGLQDFMARQLGCEIHPFSAATVGMAPDLAPGSVVALGLALAALSPHYGGINLLPPDRRQALEIRGRRRYWAAAASLIAIILILLISGLKSKERSIARTNLITDGELQSLDALEAEWQQLKEKNDALELQLQTLQDPSDGGKVVNELIRALGAAKHPDDWITLISDSTSYRPGNEDKPAPPSTAAPAALIVEGYTPQRDYSTVHAMISRLRSESFIRHVDLVPDDTIPDRSEARSHWMPLDATLFVIEVELGSP